MIAAVAAEPVPRYRPTQANAQAANAAYRWAPEKGSYEVEALEVLTLDVTEVKAMTAFMSPDLLRHFRLPGELLLAR